MGKHSEILSKYITLLFQVLVLLGLYLISLYNYLLFHSLAELFSIVVGSSIFIIAWKSQQRLDNHYFLVVGIACLFVSGLDLLHTLAYKGMGVFPGEGSNLPTQLWIVARYIQSLSLLFALLFLRRKLNAYAAFLCYAVVTALLLVAVFSDIFPMCFVEGRGLTSFKKISEYIISLMLVAAIVLLLKNHKAFDKRVLAWLVMSIIMTIAAEMAFTFYVSVYDFSNLAGHFMKIIAFYLIYKAIVETGLEKPHRLLFLNLKESEESVRTALGEVRRLATTDFLTGLYNRRHFFEMAEREFQRARRYGQSLCAMMLDLDHFKLVNDTYGHAVGDQVLKEIAECCRNELRGVDVLGRYGGEEFAIMLPEIDLSTAFQVAERLRKSIARKTVDAKRSLLVITVSIGVSAVEDEDLSVEDVIGRADKALYSAKRGGRNRVCSD